MNNCTNHPEKKALSICHVCKKEFCELCLVEGREYYYCKNPECQKIFQQELEINNVPQSVICPKCDSELELTAEETKTGKTHCPECEAVIDFTCDPPKVLEDEQYQEILRSLNQGDIGIIESILEDGNIDYFVLGEHFLSVRPLLEPVRIFVNAKQLKEAEELLKDFEPKIFGFSSRQDEDFE